MSIYSGKCDLADHISGLAGWHDKDGNPVKMGDPNVGAYYSDEWADFLVFKEKTGGILYQDYLICGVDCYNAEFIKAHNALFDFEKHTEKIPNKRSKKGYVEKEVYSFTYLNKKYTEKEARKLQVTVAVKIHFETLVDLIKYYPYIVSFAASDNETMTVHISRESYVDTEYKQLLSHGYESSMKESYDQALAKHYIEIINAYYPNDGCYKK